MNIVRCIQKGWYELKTPRSASLFGALSPLALVVCSALAQANELCLMGCPTGSPETNRRIERPIYVLSNNGRTKFADWVAYRVTRETIGPTQKRIWQADPDIPPDETLKPSDYFGANASLGIDRGHQVPLASVTGTEHWPLANYLSNITPQASALNQGAWERLESAERALALSDGLPVFVVTGTLYEKDTFLLPRAQIDHVVPSGYWKVVAKFDGEGVSAASFILHQDTSRAAIFCNFVVTVDEVERRTNLTLFPELPMEKKDKMVGGAGGLLKDLGCDIKGQGEDRRVTFSPRPPQ